MEVLVVGAIILFIFIYNGTINKNKFFIDNKEYLDYLRESDYNFLCFARYGDDVDPDILFSKRITHGVIVFFVVMVYFLSKNNGTDIIDSQFLLHMVISIVAGAGIFKIQYIKLSRYYKRHLHEIDLLLPYYLKSLEILIQHYTVPVALGKSISDAPDIFKPGLQRLVEKINAGDATVAPYMEFAQSYPVRDSMRMMRLLYRLSLGGSEGKQERILMFSRSISSLQAKARETKYKERLDKMESQTMKMLGVSGFGMIIVILVALAMVFTSL